MSLYKPNNFSYRDTLPVDNPEKVIKGQTFDIEFDAIARAFNSVEHILDPDNDGLDAIVEEAPIDGQIYARQDGHWVKLEGAVYTDQVLLRTEGRSAMTQKDANEYIYHRLEEIESGASSISWDEIADKPAQINALGVQDIITGGSF